MVLKGCVRAGHRHKPCGPSRCLAPQGCLSAPPHNTHLSALNAVITGVTRGHLRCRDFPQSRRIKQHHRKSQLHTWRHSRELKRNQSGLNLTDNKSALKPLFLVFLYKTTHFSEVASLQRFQASGSEAFLPLGFLFNKQNACDSSRVHAAEEDLYIITVHSYDPSYLESEDANTN